MTPNRLEDRLRRTTKAAWQELDGEVVLLVSEEQKLLGLNSVAGRIWQLADGNRTVDEIVGILAREFDGAEDAIRRDASSFVDRLIERGLIERCGS